MEAFLDSREPLPDGWEGDLNFCLLQHMQMECPQCLGGSSQSKSCMVTGCHCCQSEFVKEDPMQVDGKRRMPAANRPAAEVGQSEGAGPMTLAPTTETRPINPSVARKLMAVRPGYERYEYDVKREDLRPYLKGLELRWQSAEGQPALWHAVCVRESEVIDPEGSVRLWFEDEDEFCVVEKGEPFEMRERLGPALLPVKWWTHVFFKKHPLTSFRMCRHAIRNLVAVDESHAAWPPSWGTDVSDWGLRHASDKELAEDARRRPSSAKARAAAGLVSATRTDRCNFCNRQQKNISTKDLNNGKLLHDFDTPGTFMCRARDNTSQKCMSKHAAKANYHPNMAAEKTVAERFAAVAMPAPVLAIPAPSTAPVVATPSTCDTGTTAPAAATPAMAAPPTPSAPSTAVLASTPAAGVPPFLASMTTPQMVAGRVPAARAYQRPKDDDQVVTLTVDLPLGLQKMSISVWSNKNRIRLSLRFLSHSPSWATSTRCGIAARQVRSPRRIRTCSELAWEQR